MKPHYKRIHRCSDWSRICHHF